MARREVGAQATHAKNILRSSKCGEMQTRKRHLRMRIRDCSISILVTLPMLLWQGRRIYADGVGLGSCILSTTGWNRIRGRGHSAA